MVSIIRPYCSFLDLENKGYTLQETINAVWEQNFSDDPKWTAAKMLGSCRLAFRKSRRGSSQSAMILGCSVELRNALVQRGRLYIGWESCRVEDFTTAICCPKCAQYGHGERKCRQEANTCYRCGVLDHKSEDCKVESRKCATCHRFGQKGSETHETGARDCPARTHAEKRMAEATAHF
ncbi:hypothetical protein ACJJTC_002856 [Scirpophaga incertulas]